jgi:hypothetical protein
MSGKVSLSLSLSLSLSNKSRKTAKLSERKFEKFVFPPMVRPAACESIRYGIGSGTGLFKDVHVALLSQKTSRLRHSPLAEAGPLSSFIFNYF